MADVRAADEANRSRDLGVALDDLPDKFLVHNPAFQQKWRLNSSLDNAFATANPNIPSPFSPADLPIKLGNPNPTPSTFDLQDNYQTRLQNPPPPPPPPQNPLPKAEQSSQFQPPQQPFPAPEQSSPFPPPPTQQKPFLVHQHSFQYAPPPPPQQPFPVPPPPSQQQPSLAHQYSFQHPPPPPPQQPSLTPQQSFSVPPPPAQQQPFLNQQHSFQYPPPPPQQQTFPGPQQSFPFPPPPQQQFPSNQQYFRFPLPPPPPLPPLVSYRTVTNEYYHYLPLNQAITRGELEAVKAFLDEQPDAATASLLENGFTALHSACHNGQVEIVEELLNRISPDDVIVERDDLYHTPLTAAAIHGSIDIAEALIRKNQKLLEMPGYEGDIPVVSAIVIDQKIMARYLYAKTPLRLLLDNNGYHGTLLLSSAIFFKMLDIALHLFQSCPRLAVTKNHIKSLAPLCVLASRPNLFPSGTKLGFWHRFLYSNMSIEEPSARLETFDQPQNQGLLGRVIAYFSKILGINEIHQLKKTHLQAQKLLRGIAAETSMMSFSDRNINGIFEAMWLAVKFGNVEYIIEMIRTNPEFLRVANTDGKSLFLSAVEHRQEKIFSLLYSLDNKKSQVISDLDSARNGILHYAGFLAPSDRLKNIPGAALQLQRELQWFKEVERIVPHVHAERLNSQSLKPRDVFTICHAELHKEAEKWMKDTAMACSFVAALIVTVTFAAGFTVPGGTDQNVGSPLRLKDNRFTFFIISDIISFFSSSTSVLIFLGILTARYSEDDFLVSLPTKMIAGLSIMFLSIAAMLLAFSAALFTLLYHWTWIVIPVILLVCLPVLLFILLQYPLLAEMISSTYGRGIFNRNMKPCF